MLRGVRIKIYSPIFLGGIPWERVVVLRNVEEFYLAASDGGDGYTLATHMSCPSAKHTTLTHMRDGEPDLITLFSGVFPSSVSWNAIIPQYTRSPVEEVAFEVESNSLGPSSVHINTYSLNFRSADTTVIKLRFKVSGVLLTRSFAGTYREVFSQASRLFRHSRYWTMSSAFICLVTLDSTPTRSNSHASRTTSGDCFSLWDLWRS